MNQQEFELIKQAAFQRGFQKQAVWGIEKIGPFMKNLPWRSGSSLGTTMLPGMTGGGAVLGGLGNVLLGDEGQGVSERLLKGMLAGGVGGAASAYPTGIAAQAVMRRREAAAAAQAMRQLEEAAEATSMNPNIFQSIWQRIRDMLGRNNPGVIAP